MARTIDANDLVKNDKVHSKRLEKESFRKTKRVINPEHQENANPKIA
jgi:hypothetical protein